MKQSHVGLAIASVLIVVGTAASVAGGAFVGCGGVSAPPTDDAGSASDGGPGDAGPGNDVGLGDAAGLPTTLETYPRTDGSTSTLPLDRVIACALLGLGYRWEPGRGSEGEAEIVPVATTDAEAVLAAALLERIVHSRTHDAFVNLIDGNADLIFVANLPSAEERDYAAARGVTLAWDALALDALVIIDNAANTVTDLSPEEIRSIYQQEITLWSEVGGASQAIHPFVRPASSGSQQLFDTIVMRGEPMAAWPDDRRPSFMGALIDEVRGDPQAIGYSVYYWVTYQYPATGYHVMTIDGLAPSRDSIGTRTYPFTSEVWMIRRADLARETSAAHLRDWLLTPAGQAVVARSGYVPIDAP